MRAYTVAAAAVTLGVPKKWIDNVLSHYEVEGVVQQRQGIVRRITPAGLLNLEIALHLNRTLDIPVKTALAVASQVAKAEGGEVQLSDDGIVQLRVNVHSVSQSLIQRLDRALEITPTPRRGRPPRK
ncbi:MAG TPA: hypothetical protein VM099_10445 [Gemmatimonadaceae bacterium]|nr:hypothetical protein [Gemmatimonadaceae bacterium]